MSGPLWQGPGPRVDALPVLPRQRGGTAADPVDALAERLHDVVAAAVHPDEIAAVLESDGMTDDHIRLTYGRPDSFTLAEELYAKVPRAHPEPPGPPADPWQVGLLGCLLRGLVFALPGLAHVLAAPLLAGAALAPLLAGALTGWTWNQALSHRAYAWLGLGDRASAVRCLRAGAPAGAVLGTAAALLCTGAGQWPSAVFAAVQSLYLAAATPLLVLDRERALLCCLSPLPAGTVLVLLHEAIPLWARTGLLLASLTAALATATAVLRPAAGAGTRLRGVLGRVRRGPGRRDARPPAGQRPYGDAGPAAGDGGTAGARSAFGTRPATGTVTRLPGGRPRGALRGFRHGWPTRRAGAEGGRPRPVAVVAGRLCSIAGRAPVSERAGDGGTAGVRPVSAAGARPAPAGVPRASGAGRLCLLRAARRRRPPLAAPRLVASVPHGLSGLGVGALVLYTALGDVLGGLTGAAVAAPSAVALTLSMGPAEWLLHRFRSETLAGLRASTTARAFWRAAAAVLAECLAGYLAVLFALALAGTLLWPGAPALGGVRLATLLLIGTVLWTGLLLQSFGAVTVAAGVCCAAALVQTAALVTGTGSPRAAGLAVAATAAAVLAGLVCALLGRATAHRV
ncbi:hypothetical protein QFZ82_005733 [Streptomyces sp. V4I23]|uniref:hypothetical protein n=1 Tax=Streptomyces sp. V4I23 TaxID=3042282 RepID=UPI002781C3EE|nr:hypothetical protein [Streptomyces sp. V4I23]MDQ1011248.1 hypothetical protein [Streptomyces sp. V4I23]